MTLCGEMQFDSLLAQGKAAANERPVENHGKAKHTSQYAWRNASIEENPKSEHFHNHGKETDDRAGHKGIAVVSSELDPLEPDPDAKREQQWGRDGRQKDASEIGQDDFRKE